MKHISIIATIVTLLGLPLLVLQYHDTIEGLTNPKAEPTTFSSADSALLWLQSSEYPANKWGWSRAVRELDEVAIKKLRQANIKQPSDIGCAALRANKLKFAIGNDLISPSTKCDGLSLLDYISPPADPALFRDQTGKDCPEQKFYNSKLREWEGDDLLKEVKSFSPNERPERLLKQIAEFERWALLIDPDIFSDSDIAFYQQQLCEKDKMRSGPAKFGRWNYHSVVLSGDAKLDKKFHRLGIDGVAAGHRCKVDNYGRAEDIASIRLYREFLHRQADSNAIPIAYTFSSALGTSYLCQGR